jgi:hypothetical protein
MSVKRPLYTGSRFVASLLILTYGFAKLNGSQFTVLDSELDKPLGEVSGFWLTWYYFGYSPVYGAFIALAQVAGGLLLTFRRTALLGACLLLPIVTNIIFVDIFYGIELEALGAALVVEAALLVIVSAHRGELFELFWKRQNSAFPAGASTRRAAGGKYAARALMLVVPAVFTYWLANYNNRVPTPLDGVWDVSEVSANLGASAGVGVPSVVFFERNRPHLCVFKLKDGTYDRHHFEVDEGARAVRVGRYWMRKGAEVFEGGYELDGRRLRLSGRFRGASGDSTLVLTRRE